MTSEALPEPIEFGRYTLEHRLATGGMAEIFLARQEGPGGFSRQLVIKKILPHYAGDAGFVEMFLDEAKLAAQLNHPNIVPIYDFGEVDGAWYLAMELVKGPDVRNVLEAVRATGHHLPHSILARMISDAAGGLEHAHRLTAADGTPLNIIHRDISPSNLIVSRDGVTKILDFGIAKADQASHKTRTGIIKGKIAYMPPEQIEGERLDARADVYSLGVVLFELAAGRTPFVGESDFKLMRSICDTEPPSPREISDDVPEALEDIILKAIANNRDDRFSSARAFAAELDRFSISHGGPVSAFDVAEALLELADEYEKPMTVMARAGLRDHSSSSHAMAKQSSHPIQKSSSPADEPSPEGEDDIHDESTVLRPGLSDAEEQGAEDSPSTSPSKDATVLRPGLSHADKQGAEGSPSTSPSENATVLRPGLSDAEEQRAEDSPSTPPSEDATVLRPGLSTTQEQREEADGSIKDLNQGRATAANFCAAVGGNETSPHQPPSTGPGRSKAVLVGGALAGALVLAFGLFHTLPRGTDDEDRAPRPFPPESPTEQAKGSASIDKDADTNGEKEYLSEPELEVSNETAEKRSEAGEDRLEEQSAEDDQVAKRTIEDPQSAEPEAVVEPTTEPIAPGSAQKVAGTPIDTTTTDGERPSRPNHEAPTAASPATGFVMVQSRPWSNIYVDGELIGSTPRRVELSVGRHELLLRQPDIEVERTVDVRVRRGEMARVSVPLGEGRVALLIRPRGEVWVDGEKKGVTPMPPLVLPAGRQTIEIVNPETGERTSHTVDVPHGETATLRVDLSQ